MILADAIRDGYEDLFAVNRDAHTMSQEDVHGKLKTLTRGQKSDNVITWMTNTFLTLRDLADWSPLAPTLVETQPSLREPPETTPAQTSTSGVSVASSATLPRTEPPPLELHYNIQIILPESRDQAVYDALFASLRKHLL